MASGSRYSLLGEEDLDPHTPPGQTLPPPDDTTPHAPSQHSTCPPSPTPTLEPLRVPTEWHWGGIIYNTPEEVAHAAGASFNVNEKYVDFILAMINDVAWRDIFSVYNQLGDKMYKHRNKTVADIHNLRTQQVKCVGRTEYLNDVSNLQS